MDPKREEQEKGRNWLSNDILFTPKQKGGLGFINFRDFVKALKILWIKRYTEGCNDHWCDLIDLNIGLNPTNRHQLTEWGDLDFWPIKRSNLICISSMFISYSEFVRKFPTEPEAMDNRWLEQAVFNNSKIKAKIKNHKNQGHRLEPLTTKYYKLPKTLKIKIIDLYKGGKFIDEENLEALIHRKTDNPLFTIRSTTHCTLKDYFSNILGGKS